MRSFLTTLRAPRHLLRASACCGVCDCMRFGADFGPKFSKNFVAAKFLRSRSREIAPKSVRPGGAQLPHDPMRSPTTVPSVGMLCRVRLHAISSRFRTEIFENSKFCVRNRVRSRRNPCRLVVRSLLTILKGPQHLCGASACCGTRDCMRFAGDFGPKFSKFQNFASEIA